jgi:hypothetical protein
MNSIYKQFKVLKFTKKRMAILPDYRPMYKLAQIVLVLKISCRTKTSSLLKLHLFSWALRSDKNMDELSFWVRNRFKKQIPIWNIDPALNRALELAIIENLCEIHNGKYRLTTKGEEFCQVIRGDSDILEREITFLERLGSKVTEKQIDNITQIWKSHA